MNVDWSCEQAILVFHDLKVDYITEQLYFYSINSTFSGWVTTINYKEWESSGDHEHNISVLSKLGLIERCNKPNTNNL